jgi:hypothetical protein
VQLVDLFANEVSALKYPETGNIQKIRHGSRQMHQIPKIDVKEVVCTKAFTGDMEDY